MSIQEDKYYTDNQTDTEIDCHTNHITGTSNVSTSSTTYVDMPNMSITRNFSGKEILTMFNASVNISNSGEHAYFRIILDDEFVKTYNCASHTGGYSNITLMHLEALPSGIHTLKVQWKVTGGTVYNWASTFEMRRELIAVEVK